MAERFYISQANDTPELAILLVCVNVAFTQQMEDLLRTQSWQSQTSSFDRYLSPERRPALGAGIRAAGCCIAFIDFDVDAAQAALTAQYLQSMLGEKVLLVAVAEHLAPPTMLSAMRAGCTEFINTPSAEHTLLDTLERLTQRTPSQPRKQESTGSVIAFFGAKGGAGTTTLAVHLAYYLVKMHKKRVLLIDHHAELGHVCVHLGLDGTRFLFQEVVRNVNRLDSELLGGFVARHASGLEVLASPDHCGAGKPMDPSAISRTLEFLRNEYDYVVLDCGLPTDELNTPVIELSSTVYVVATPEVGAIRDLSRYVDVLNPSANSMDRLKVVINRFSAPLAIGIPQIEKAIKLPVAIRIASSDVDFVPAANLGEPLAPAGRSDVVGQLLKWSNTVTGSVPPAVSNAPEHGKGLFGMLKQIAATPARNGNEVKTA